MTFVNLRIMDRYSSSSSRTLSSSDGGLLSQQRGFEDVASVLSLSTGCVNEVVSLVELFSWRWPGRKFLNSAGSSAISMRRMSDCRELKSSSVGVVFVHGMLQSLDPGDFGSVSGPGVKLRGVTENSLLERRLNDSLSTLSHFSPFST